MSAPVFILHWWRLRRIRRAMREFGASVEAYERAYGRPPFTTADPQAVVARTGEIEISP